jgi:hypothetical protein
MYWEKEIRVRITIRRIVIAVLATSTVANLVIVGAAVGADSPPVPTITAVFTTSLSAPTFLIPNSAAGETATLASTSPPGMTPTDTFTPTPSSQDSPVWIMCIKKFYWPSYRILPGDTLFSIALITGSSVGELTSANCLMSNQIYAGQWLYVPRLLSNTFTPTVTNTSTSTQIPAVVPTDTPTITPTYTPTTALTSTDTPTVTPSITLTNAPTDTPTFTPTATFTVAPTITQTPTYTLTPTPTNTLTITITIPPSVVPTAVISAG